MAVTGTKWPIMAMSGSLMLRPVQNGDRTRMAIGLTPMSAGPGYRMKISAGPPTTMAAGSDWRIMVGAGFPAMNGDRPGFHGGPAEIISAGLRCLRKDRADSVMNVADSLRRVIACCL